MWAAFYARAEVTIQYNVYLSVIRYFVMIIYCAYIISQSQSHRPSNYFFDFFFEEIRSDRRWKEIKIRLTFQPSDIHSSIWIPLWKINIYCRKNRTWWIRPCNWTLVELLWINRKLNTSKYTGWPRAQRMIMWLWFLIVFSFV